MTELRKGITAAVLTAVLAAQVVACSGGGAGSARVSSPDERLTDSEWDYGASFTRDVDGVTFQPDVVIPGGGADAVVEASGDGLTWILDGDAAEVDDLEPGKVLLATNRAAGRVLAVEELEDGNVAVTVGPMDLTDAIRDIDTSYEGAIDPDLVQIRTAPGLPAAADVTNREAVPGAEPDPAEVTARAASPLGTGARTAVPFLASAPGHVSQELPDARGILPPPSAVPLPVVPVTGMRVFPLHGSDGSWGVELGYDRNGLKIVGSARVYMERPTIQFELVIRDAKIITAEAQLSGVAGVRASFEAGTELGLQANIHQIVDLPLDINVPIFGPLLPFSANFHQSFKIDTVFSAKNSTLKFDGDYAFSGSLRAGYRDGTFGVSAPSGLHVKRSLLQSTEGVSLGVNGFVIAHKLQMTIGIGGFGFAVGPYVSLTTAMTVVRGSDLGLVICKGATLNLDMGYGIGYVIPTAVVNVINVFLRALNLGEIKPTGGTEPVLTHLATLEGYGPKVKACQGAI